MKARPMLMSAPMVRAILAGTKTQTRRIINAPKSVTGFQHFHEDRWDRMQGNVRGDTVRCPYGQPGDRLWVREAWARTSVFPGTDLVVYREGDSRTDYGGPWKPSIHMPRWASRITLEVTGVRVERLQDISDDDAAAEGIERTRRGDMWRTYRPDCVQHWNTDAELGHKLASSSYASLWESINGPGSWEANPWVWVVEFKRLEVQQ